MSRIGKNPITIPDKVEVKVSGHTVSVKGPKGQLEKKFTDKVKVEIKGKLVQVTLAKPNDKTTIPVWGTVRTLINNMVLGVSTGFVRTLEFNGVGYKAATKGNQLELSLGFSHPVVYDLPKGIVAKVQKNLIELYGSDKELLGFVASKIRSFRPPEPYKGKGVKYIEETIIRKAGKAGAKAT